MPRSSHPSARLALKPRGPAFQSRLPMRLRVAPHPASSGSAGDRVSSCPVSRVLQHIRRSSSGLPHSFALPVVPVDASPRLPRLLHLPAVPAMDLRVAPNLASFSASGAQACELPRSFAPPIAPVDESPGCPGFCIFRLCRRRTLELPRVSRPSAPLALVLRVSPRLRASRCASRYGCGFPRTPIPSGFTSGLSPQVAPFPRSLGTG